MSNKMKILFGEIWRMAASVLLMGTALLMFTAPNNIVPGGVSGLSTALARVLPLRIGTINLIISILIEGAGGLVFGWRFIVRSSLISATLSVFLNTFEGILPVYTANPLVASIVGGLLFGTSSSLLLSKSISSGGTETICLILKRFSPRLREGQLLMLLDGIVVLTGMLIFKDIDSAIYSVFAIFTSSKVLDTFMMGLDRTKLLYIVSDKSMEIRDHFVDEMDLGVTVLYGEGGYARTPKNILMLAAHKNDFPRVMQIVRSIDKDAFTIISEAGEVWGEGFKEHAKEPPAFKKLGIGKKKDRTE